MTNLIIKLFFLSVTICILLYLTSYSKFEITQNNNVIVGILIFLFTLFSVIFSNIVFWIS